MDLQTVDALARLQLEARRVGLELRVVDAPRDFVELIEFAGLTEALRVEPCGQSEEREERLRVEEERQLGDLPA
jgi:gamma-glutamyl:cysteine ligase YbdK (ATP-grasp superfamily)